MKTQREASAHVDRSEQNTVAERNKNLMRRAIEEIWNGEKYENLDKFISPDFVVHLSPDEEIQGREAARQFYIQLRKAFPDIHFTIRDLIAENDRVVTHWVAEGTHQGEYKGIPPTGKKFSLTAINIDRMVDGFAVECWTRFDELGLLRQLGVTLPPGLEQNMR
ncbi:MAG TPA: ester cyclase [Cyclobacteriaceae bacterium]